MSVFLGGSHDHPVGGGTVIQLEDGGQRMVTNVLVDNAWSHRGEADVRWLHTQLDQFVGQFIFVRAVHARDDYPVKGAHSFCGTLETVAHHLNASISLNFGSRGESYTFFNSYGRYTNTHHKWSASFDATESKQLTIDVYIGARAEEVVEKLRDELRFVSDGSDEYLGIYTNFDKWTEVIGDIDVARGISTHKVKDWVYNFEDFIGSVKSRNEIPHECRASLLEVGLTHDDLRGITTRAVAYSKK
jgi:hypothetical protein